MRGADIELQRQVYVVGGDVAGSVHFSLDEPVPYRSATISLIGKERTQVSYQAGKYRATATEENEFLHQDQSIPFRTDEKGRIIAAAYDIPFRFTVPQESPQSYEGEHGRIVYAIIVHVDIPLGSDINESMELTVISSGTPTAQSHPVNAVSDSWGFPQDPGVSFALEGSAFQTGETLNGRYAFRNPTAKTIRSVEIRLKCKETATARGHTARTDLVSEASEIPIGRRALQGQAPFSIRIPEGAPFTNESSLINVEYTLTVSLDIAWASDVAASETIDVVARPEIVRPPEERRLETKRCQNCGEVIMPFNATYCSNCGMSTRRISRVGKPPGIEDKTKQTARVKVLMDQANECMICNLEINEGDDIVWCPHCGNPAHRDHLVEWIRSKHACPMCGENLSDQDFR
jgi:predicted RNA-binding Zn-ribbon protein involved in translation (DUF1610 family)